MPVILRDYQITDTAAIYDAWGRGKRNVLYRCPTGGGKTVVGGVITSQQDVMSAIIAHRSELILQQSMMLCELEVRHRIIASKAVTQFIIREQRRQHGRDYFDPNGRAAVVAVDTLNARSDKLKDWCNQVGFWLMDEGKHLLRDNKWGTAVKLFPNAWGLGLDATPNRADGKGIGRHAEGVFDEMVQGPSVSELMEQGYLSQYKIYAPPSDFDLSALKGGGTGDYTRNSMIEETGRSHIIGDIVDHYLRIAPGKRAIVFAVDIASSALITAAFIERGVRAASVNGKTKDTIREEMVRRFRNGDLDVLVNVDLFGEGFDVPACEVVIMARPTQSLPLYLQMFGRVLRIFEGKTHGIVIDHVSNVKQHLLPDSPRIWNLDDRDKKARSARDPDAMPITTCPKCHRAYEATTNICPWCGHKAEPVGRSLPEQVDGDLFELSAEALAKLRGQVASINGSSSGVENMIIAQGGQKHVAKIIAGNHRTRKTAHVYLKIAMDLWAGQGHAKGHGESELYRRFYHMFGVDVLTAQTFSRVDAEKLTQKIGERIGL